MFVDGPWRYAPATQAVMEALTSGGGQVLFVGGCVRNALLGVPVTDIDIATDLLPERVMVLASDAGLKPLPTGINHGTVTVVADGTPYEVTTFRKDVHTDGRHARVEFSNRIEEDAARRDFTMNALYARADGRIEDPLGGLTDLANRRVRFIGTASNRIQEDYLRSLRFFRFHAWYEDPHRGFDPDVLDAIARNLDGLDRLSRERVTTELWKLWSAADPAPAMAAMQQTGVLMRVLPGADDQAMASLVHLEALLGLTPSPQRRLALLMTVSDQLPLRLSRADMKVAMQLSDAARGTMAPAELGYRLGYAAGCDAVVVRAALTETPVAEVDLSAVKTGSDQVFPISAADLMPAFQGPVLGQELDRLAHVWIASGFKLTGPDLLTGKK